MAVMDPALSPMLCNPVDIVPTSEDWILEGKLDGWRLVAHNDGERIRVFAGRNGSEYTGKLPYIEEALASALPADTSVDGEIIGKQWGDVQGVMTRGAGPHVPTPAVPALTYVIFDVTRLLGHDIRSAEWIDRRSYLEQFHIDEWANLDRSAYAPASDAAHEAVLALGLEGSVCKYAKGRYVNGRSPLWVKIKPQQTTEAEIVGFKEGTGNWAGKVGAFKVRLLDTEAETTVKCGTNERHEDAHANPNNWLGVVIELKHHGWEASGKVRHPQYLRRRDDRDSAQEPRKPKEATTRMTTTTRRQRNYSAMGDAKLMLCVAQLSAGKGEAYDRCVNSGSGDPAGDLTTATNVAAQRGLL